MSVGIRFSQMTVPPLEAGEYEIKVEQVTSLKVDLGVEIVNVTVATERFNITKDQVYSVYPPENAVGDYSECLPHLVLKRRTLPWEIRLNEKRPEMPWMALLVLDETEAFSLVNASCKEALTPQHGVYVPKLKLETYEKPEAPCTYVEIPKVLFSELMPYEEDLSLLAHGKGVSLDYKVTDQTVNDNWFATVVAGRFCLMPTDVTHALTHTAMLVSLEGFEGAIKDLKSREAFLEAYDSVRMIVLSSWTFAMAKPLFDFGSVFKTLDVGIFETPYDGESQTLQMLCKQGYYPMNHHIREGSQTVSWYQSPLIPYLEPSVATKCFQFADQLLCYDPELSLFDIRFAAAWQIGKLMALADQGFAQKLFNWRMNNQKIYKTTQYHNLILGHLNHHSTEALKHSTSRNVIKSELEASLQDAILEVLDHANTTQL